MTIKMMDDYLDGPLDRLIGKKTWAADLQEATLPYALLAFSLAVIAEPTWSITLFWASYAVGMRGDRLRPLPLGLTGWQEALLLGVLTLSAFGWKALVTSWAAIFSLQAVDDLLDHQQDKMCGAANWATRWGVVETGLAAAIAIALLCYLDVIKLLLVSINGPLIVSILRHMARKEDEISGQY